MHRAWTKQYQIEMFYSGDSGVNKAELIKYNAMTPRFYKYRDDSENSIEAFRNNILYFSSASEFNDPYECTTKEIDTKKLVEKFLYRKGIDINCDKETRDYFDVNFEASKNVILKGNPEPEIDITSIANEVYRSCCFSEINDSILMWSHYSNNHKGFCIGYDFKNRRNEILTQLLHPILYTDEILDITEAYLKKNTRGITLNSLTRKSTDWHYEKEWRVIITASDNEKREPVKMFMPSEIYLGSQIENEVRDQLILIASGRGIPVYQTKRSKNDYQLSACLI